MKRYLTTKNLLLAILTIAFFLRFWNVWNQDLFGDEAADAFRAIGYVDYLGTSFQTQPIDWYNPVTRSGTATSYPLPIEQQCAQEKDILTKIFDFITRRCEERSARFGAGYKNQPLPWWTKLSFHDFPPLGMLIMNFFFQLFGDSLLVARLPAIIAGVLSVYLLYLIVKKLFKDENLALFSALFFAINGALVWVFRISILEPILLFFILLNIYFFLQFLENKRKWRLFGITLGLVALTKYTGVFLVPVYFSYLILGSISGFRESKGFPKSIILKDWRIYAALGLALLMFSPVIAYNFYLYQATGHFDLQLAYLFGQETPEWTGLSGKIQAPFSQFWKNLAFQPTDTATGFVLPAGYYGISAMIFVLAGLIYSYFIFRKNRSSGILFFWLYAFFVTLLLIKIGSAHRFLTLYGPAFSVFAGLFLVFLWDFWKETKWNYWSKTLVLSFVILEIFHSVNTNFIKFPDYGMAKLDRYFEQEFAGAKSAVIPESDNPHLNKVINKFALKKSRVGDRKFWLIVYNDNVALPTLEWIFYRRFFYQNIPALFVENFIKTSNEQGLNYFDGFQIYFVQSAENAVLNPFKQDKTAALEMENFLLRKGLQPAKIIYGKSGLPMFKAYKFFVSDII